MGLSCASLTVAICTRNNASSLSQTLSALVDRLPHSVDLLVVDNASEDDTKGAVESVAAAATSHRVQYSFEPRLGLSAARNKAIADSATELIGFLDDDAEPLPGWAEAVSEAFCSNPGLTALGGPIELAWDGGVRPPWLPESMDWIYSALDLGPMLRPFPEGRSPYGTNMVFLRSAVLETPFDDRFVLYNDEVSVFRRLAKLGAEVLYVPEARVRHRIGLGRQCPEYAVKRLRLQGAAHRQLSGAAAGSSVKHALGLVRELAVSVLFPQMVGLKGVPLRWRPAMGTAFRVGYWRDT